MRGATVDRFVLRLLLRLTLSVASTGAAWATPTDIAFRSSSTISAPVASANQRFGADIAVLGDLNGNGVDDLAVVSEGNRCWILLMNADGSVASSLYHSFGLNGLPASPNGGFLSGVESLGDLDGDGVVDIAVGDPRGGNPQYGNVWIFFLNSNGSIKAYQRITNNVGGFTGPLLNQSQYGHSIAYLGDIDGDGNQEMAVGAPQGYNIGPGEVWLLDLSPAGIVTAHARIPGVPGFNVSFVIPDLLGSAVEAIGDLDGNGTPELAIGASNDALGANPRTGSVWILFMNSDYSVDHYITIGPGSGGLIQPPQEYASFGSALAWLPNAGCGRQALAVGAPGVMDAVWYLMLSDGGTVDDDYVMAHNDPSFPDKVLNLDRWGEGLSSLGDRDGNGITDVAIGNAAYSGSVHLVTLETCRIEPRRIDMGSVLIGEDSTASVTITNNGCVTRNGPITLSGSNYVLNGPESISLEPGASQMVTLRFAPSDVENPTAVLATPGGEVSFTGVGYFPACQGRWNAATFNAANLDTIAGNHAMWCGVPGGTPNVKYAPGYADNWNELLYFSAPAPYSHVPTDVAVTFVYNMDMPQYAGDEFSILTYRTGSLIPMHEMSGSTRDSNGEFTMPGVALVQFTVQPSDYIDLGDGEKGIAVVLRVLTDYMRSDGDFLIPIDTKGAIQLDNLVVKFNDQVVSSADFEPNGSDGGWCNGPSYPTPDPAQNWSSAFGAPPGGKGLNGAGFAFTIYQGLLVVGGEFTQAGSVAAKRVAGWNGTEWQGFGNGIDNGTVWGVAEHQGSLIAAGSFTMASGAPAARVARWNGTTWSAMGAGFTNTGEALKSHNGLLYAGDGNKLSIWNGLAWSSVTAPGWIIDIEEYHGNLWLAGAPGFEGFMARWDGTSFQDLKSFNNSAYVLHVHDDLLYVGGDWNDEPAPGAGWGVSAWNGSNWATPRTDYELGSEGMATLNGRLVLGIGGGLVTSYDGAVEVPMPGIHGTVRDVATYQGDLYVVGHFTTAGAQPSRYIAKWSETLVGVRDPAPALGLKVESFPNPFNPSLRIRIEHASQGFLGADIYDVGGRRVKRLANESRAPGTVELRWDGTNDRGEATASGVYFLRVHSGRDVVTRKLVQIK